MGMICKRGNRFLIEYYSDGKPIREHIGTSKQKQAERMLKDHQAMWDRGARVTQTGAHQICRDH